METSQEAPMENKEKPDYSDITDEDIKKFFLDALTPIFTPEHCAEIMKEKTEYQEKYGSFFTLEVPKTE